MIIKPQAALTVAGIGSVDITGVTIDTAVNEVPAANVKYHKADGNPVRKAIAEYTQELLAEQQDRVLSGRTAPDARLEITGLPSGDIAMEGYLATPLSRSSSGSVFNGASILGVDTELNSVKTHFYEVVNTSVREKADVLASLYEVRDIGGPLQDRFLAMFELLLSTGEDVIGAQHRDVTKAIFAAQHDVNTSTEAWANILKNSDISRPKFERLMNSHKHASSKVNKTILQIMQKQHPSFWFSMRSLLEKFGLYYAPNLLGSGSIRDASSYYTSEPEPIELDPVTLSGGVAARTTLPVTQVLMEGTVMNTIRKGKEHASIVAAFPRQSSGLGAVQQIPSPPWIPDVLLPSASYSYGYEYNGKGDLTLNLRNRRSRTNKIHGSDQLATSKRVQACLDEYAELRYNDLKWQDSTASLTLPMGLANVPDPGKRVRVTSGESTFTGCVRRVRHSVSIESSTVSQVNTAINFSHVEH